MYQFGTQQTKMLHPGVKTDLNATLPAKETQNIKNEH